MSDQPDPDASKSVRCHEILEELDELKSRIDSYDSRHSNIQWQLEIIRDLNENSSSLLNNATILVKELQYEHTDLIESINKIRLCVQEEFNTSQNAESTQRTIATQSTSPDVVQDSDSKKLEEFAVLLRKGLIEKKEKTPPGNSPSCSNSTHGKVSNTQIDEDGFQRVNPKKAFFPKIEEPKKVYVYPPVRKTMGKDAESSSQIQPKAEDDARKKPEKVLPIGTPETKRSTKTEEVVAQTEPTAPILQELREEVLENAELVQSFVEDKEPSDDAQKKERGLSKQQLKQMKDKEKREQRKAEKKAAEEAEKVANEAKLAELTVKREEFDSLVKIYCLIGAVQDKPIIDGFDETAARKFLADRVHCHQRQNNDIGVMYCQVLLENMCPIIIDHCRQIFDLRTCYLDVLAEEKHLITTIRTMAIVFKCNECISVDDIIGAKMYVRKFIDNYIGVQEEIRKRKAKIPKVWSDNPVLKSILMRNKSGGVEGLSWETAKKHFLRVSCYYDSIKTSNQKLYSLIYSEMAETEHDVFLLDGNVLADLDKEGVSRVFLLGAYTCMVASMEAL